MKKFYHIGIDATADPAAVIVHEKARFTILTSRLIRLEYDPLCKFEDRPTNIVWNRKFDVIPEFTVEKFGEKGIVIKTEHLTVEYTGDGNGLHDTTLKIYGDEFDTWHPYAYDVGNLKGTVSTLDGVGGPIELEPGILSKAGWTVIDDSKGLVLNDEDWIEPRYSEDDSNAVWTQDIYFFGYGRDYRQCLRDYKVITGKTDMFPRYVLGNWWSRYYAYTQDEIKSLVEDFKSRKIPISIFIIDMDWHIVDNEYHSGWTGYIIAKKAMEKDTGARALRAIIEEFMLDIMYEIPKDDNIGQVTITGAYIEGTGGPVIDIRNNSMGMEERKKLNEISQ